MHPAWGLGFFIVVNYMVGAELRWRERARLPFWVAPAARIGLFSYSLYLIHELVLMETWKFYFLGMSDTMTGLLITTPLSVVAAWGYYVFCEKPFLVKKHRVAADTEVVVQVDPVSA
jgi:peptidoglycan/LPS O-acetylase OafA/YrhL